MIYYIILYIMIYYIILYIIIYNIFIFELFKFKTNIFRAWKEVYKDWQKTNIAEPRSHRVTKKKMIGNKTN